MIRKFLILVLLIFTATMYGSNECFPKSEITKNNLLPTAKSEIITDAAPDFTLYTLSGDEVKLSDYLGKVVILDFWATWCPHCRRQLKELTQNRQAIEASGITIILVDVGENLQKIEGYIAANNISFDVFLDENAETAKKYNIVGVPTFFFINKEGTILDVKNALPDDYQKILL